MDNFFSFLFGDVPDGFINLWAFRPGTNEKQTHWWELSTKKKWSDFIAKACEMDSQGFNVYFSTCPGDRPDKSSLNRMRGQDVTWVPSFFLDIDTKLNPTKENADVPVNIDEAVFALKSITTPPNALVNSGNGVHAYWKLKNPIKVENEQDRLRVSRMMKDFANNVARKMGEYVLTGDLDTDASEPAHVLRVPGTHNYKRSIPIPVKIIDINYNAYSIDKLLSEKNAPFEIRFPSIEQKPRFLLPEQITQGERNNTLYKYGCSLRGRGRSDDEIDIALNEVNAARCKPPLEPREVIIIAGQVKKCQCRSYTNRSRLEELLNCLMMIVISAYL